MNNLRLVLICLIAVFSTVKLYSQANTVELQDGGGTFISSHASIAEAYNAIPSTISQAYIIEILVDYTGASETYPINLNLKTGHSSVNTITIRPDAGNTGESISASAANGVIDINDADYIIIDGRPGGTGSSADFIIHNLSTSGTGANTVEFNNGATNCILRYCNVRGNAMGTAGPRNVVFGTSASNVTGNSDNLVEYCNLDGNRSGVATAGTAANPNRGNVISNSTITNWGYAGVWWVSGATDLTVKGCTISGNGHSGNTIVSGIIASPTLDGSTLNVEGNKFVNMAANSTSSSLAVRGIYISGSPGTGAVININNNFVALTANYNNATIVHGIYTAGSTDPHVMNVNYNTVLIGGTQTGGIAGRLVSCGIVKQSTHASVIYTQRNNISINTRTGGTSGVVHAGCAINATNGILDIDYNCYYATGSSEGLNSYPATWDSVGTESVSVYQSMASPQEQNCRFKNVTFISDNDLHLDGASIGDPDLSARPVAGITTDIDGDSRNAAFPYKGADESTAFTLATLNLAMSFEACASTDTISVELRSSASPYELIELNRGLGGLGASHVIKYAKPVNGINYYIVVKHRNSIQTWSKAGGEAFSGGTLTYDFTTAASQAYGSNMVLVGSDYSNYTGDVQQDNIVDGTDGALIDNDAANFVTGYVVTDLNCDEVVDGSDAVFADNNAANFVSAAYP